MAEIIQRDGTWSLEGDLLRIVPGHDRSVGLLRRGLGELRVPLEALAGISFERGRRAGRLRLRLREGADPLLQVTGERLPEGADPYALTVDADRGGVAEYVVDAVREALLLDQVPQSPCTRYLLPGPRVPVSAAAGDGSVAFDGETVRLEWNWKTEEVKSSGGARTLALRDIASVEWLPSSGMENGWLRFAVHGAAPSPPAKYDPHAVELWGFRRDATLALVGAAVQARLPHPGAPREAVAEAAGTPGKDSGAGTDPLLRRLRELGELHRSGVLTDEEFSAAKQAVLKRL
ncbi:DUF4429 domain-containing protein [Streptomyces sp. NPDC049954]|uniref:DUF4429 domain-containing protein n=1 Tax=Streptomyces sp. NPDC049954 TaxID=3155779 RepID=UPI003428DCA4